MDSFVRREGAEGGRKKPAQQNFLQKAQEAAVERRNEARQAEKQPKYLGSLENTVQLFKNVKQLEFIKDDIQQLVFSEQLPKKSYRIVEVSKTMLQDFKKGQKLIFKGGQDDYCVLCTEDKTFDVKEVDMSNSLFVVPTLTDGQEMTVNAEMQIHEREIVMMTHNYFELKEIDCVSVYRLRELLHETELVWNWEMAVDGGKKYSWLELLEIIRMSEKQLKDHLEAMPVIEHQDHLRWLSYDFRDAFIEKIIDLADDRKAEGVSIEQVSFEALRRHLPSQATDSAILWFLRTFCELVEAENLVYKMLPRPMVRNRASYILRNVSGLETGTFERHLDQMLPAGIELDYTYLNGIGVITETFKGRTISYLNVEDLPENPRERLRILFERKPSWTMDEVAPYLADICATAKAISSLMVGHCRASKNPEGEKVFCSLRPV